MQGTSLLLFCFTIPVVFGNESPTFIHDLNNQVVPENTPVGTIIGTLSGTDPENSVVHYGIKGTDLLLVDRDSGEVKLMKPFDREVNDSLRFEVTLEDETNGTENNIIAVPITVIIDDVNDNPPKFMLTPYKVTVAEDTPVGSTIFRDIRVEDVDLSGDILEVSCELAEETDLCEKFHIQMFNNSERLYEGGIILKKALNYNEKQLYKLHLRASDGELNSSTTMDIRVSDVQNLPPVFHNSLTAIVEEDALINSHVITLQATDGDRGAPRPVVYDLLSNPYDYFLLDGNTGELRTAKPLDRERLADTNGVLSLSVRARELVNGAVSNDEDASAQVEIFITIRDVNDEAPKFNKNEYHVTIPENLTVGSALPDLDMIVTDADLGNNSAYTLRLEDFSGAFTVEPASAVGSTSVIIRLVNNSLDYENPNQRKFIILVIAEERETKLHLSSTATVTVEVTDVNDNAPEFENSIYTATVNESALPGTVVADITAVDKDSNVYGSSGIIYELIGEGSDRFNVNKRTGVITVALCASPGKTPCLDFETNAVYFFTYKASDHEGLGYSTPVKLKITILDGNDNPPVFQISNYTAVIDEGATKFEPPFFVKAEDADKTSRIVYSIADDSVKDQFTVDRNSGEITILNKSGLWRLNNSDTVTFFITASDGIFSAEASVHIKIMDVNNNQPEFISDSYSAYIAEDAAIGENVLKVSAVDKDTDINAELTYHIEKGSFDDFEIEGDSGVIKVASPLNYDKRNTYNITVTATDGGTPMLTGSTTVHINVINVNNKDPYFEPTFQRTEVPKDAKVGTKIYKMKAADPDIDDTESLNFAFSEPITAVNKYGKPVTDNNIYKEFFRIEKDTGEVYVSNALRREIAAVVTLTVTVTDTSAKYAQHGNGTLMVTILDVNDIPPSFYPPWTNKNPYYVENMQEELPVGSILGTYTASDPDSELIHYAIEPDSDYFMVNETTGTVSLKKRLDYEEIQQVEFTLKAYDSGVPQLSAAAVIRVNVVNINDMNPVFNASEYEATVEENSSKGTFVIKVKAVDKDLEEFGEIRYSFKGDYVNDFVIDEQTGEIRVANAATLDREKVSEIMLKVEAIDLAPPEERKSSVVPVRVKIVDVNDNPPVFTEHQYSANIVETVPYSPPSPILQLHAEDKDEKTRLRYHIVNGNDEEAFSLDFNSGILYPKRSLLGLLKHFKLTVEVTDSKFTDTAVIDVNVLDVNQNKPVFKEPSSANASVLIPENVEVNYLVTKVVAEDSDPGENGRVTYHLRVGNNDTQSTDEFYIDENNGELRTSVILDREKKASFQLILVAKDHGMQTKYETLQFLSIILKDIDDNKPVFVLGESVDYEYNFEVNENNLPNTLIGKLKAEDADEGENAKIYYYIIRGNENNIFSLDRHDGSVYVLVSLDRERNSSYEFYVKATNNANYNSAPNEIIANDDPTIAHVHVTVEDENDNAPYFFKSVYYAGVDVKSTVGEFVAEVVAVDPDLNENGQFHYQITECNLYKSGSNRSSGSLARSPFIINALGKVTIANFISEYNQDRFELHIVAAEDAPPYRETKVVLNVWVYELQQLARVILSRPPHEVKSQVHEIASELANATSNIIVVDDVRFHVDRVGQIKRDWCDMYIHMIDKNTGTIVTILYLLKVIDDKYDHLKNYYAGFAIENVLPAYIQNVEQPFEPALAALVALTIILIVGCISVLVLCCCFKHWIVLEPLDMKCDMLIKKPIIDDLSTTENPLWIEQKLKLYEEQELTMQVFCELETSRLPADASMERRGSDETSVVDNTYATIQHPGRRNSVNTMLSMGPGDYATLGGSVLPIDKTSSHTQQVIEAALGFQGCTFQVPDGPADTTELLRARSELRMNNEGQPEFISELM